MRLSHDRPPHTGVRVGGQASRPFVLAMAACAVLLISVTLLISAGAAAGSTNLLPDLRMSRIRDPRIVVTSSGRRLLRLTTWITNVGRGPFEVHGSRTSTAQSTIPVAQRVKTSAGTWWSLPTGAVMQYSGDGHNHWHTQRIATYELIPLGSQTTLRRGAKVGFCFFDTNAYRLTLPGAAKRHVYSKAGCGTRASTTITMGLSVGWADVYGLWLAYQWIDITNVPNGTYRIRATVDASNWFLESNDSNNCTWAKVRITKRAGPLAILDWANNGCAPVPPGPSPTPSPTPLITPEPTAEPTPVVTPEPTPVAEIGLPAVAMVVVPVAHPAGLSCAIVSRDPASDLR